mmetsp:Transcript_19482/g.36303  ORF Transcript_19482/g.36303 Transcript_19482/m.36303 type:complete len:640 (+) Transcript_19482:150-2069(+)
MLTPMLIVLFTVVIFTTPIEAYDSIGSKTVNVDIEWVLQGDDITFSGFFVEVLGISSALVSKFPHMRLTKSLYRYKESTLDPTNVSLEIKNQLFPREIENIETLLSTTITKNQEVDPLLFNDNVIKLDDALCDEENIIEYNSSHSASGQKFAYEYDSMSKHVVKGVQSRQDCCRRCIAEPLCMAWEVDMASTTDIQCSLKSRMVKKIKNQIGETPEPESDSDSELKSDPPAASTLTSVFKKRTQISPPRIIIMHGTACACDNKTMSPYQYRLPFKRDGNMILIGRYMLERDAERSSLSHAEHQVLHCAMLMDEIWVPSPWMADIFKRISRQLNVPLPEIIVVPEAVDTTLFTREAINELKSNKSISSEINGVCRNEECGDDVEDSTDEDTASDTSDSNVMNSGNSIDGGDTDQSVGDKFKLLSIFKWEHRKGWDVLLRAYWTAFKPKDNVVLRLQTYNPAVLVADQNNITENIIQHAQYAFGKNLDELAEVRISDSGPGYTKNSSENLSREEMRQLYATSDAFVLPTRGEGYCLPVVEAMAMSMPVIVTNCSGITAYATDENAYLIPIDETVVDGFGFVEPDFEALVSLMRRVYEYPEERAEKGRAARKSAESISPSSVVSVMTARVRELVGRRGWFDY